MSRANPVPIQFQSDVNPVPILSIHSQFNVNPSQSCANTMSIQCQSDANLVPSRCHCIPIRCQSSANPSQSDVNPMPIQRQSGANQVFTYLNLMSISCRSSANLVPIQFQYRCQSNSNPSQSDSNQVPIWCRSYANPMLILANRSPICYSLIISREGLILALSILPCPQGRISWSTPCRKIDDERMSVLHQNSGVIGKSIPSALEISLDPQDFPRASPSGNLSGLGKSLGHQGWISQYLPCLDGGRTQSNAIHDQSAIPMSIL